MNKEELQERISFEEQKKLIAAAQTIQDFCQCHSCDVCPFSCFSGVDWKRLYTCELQDRTPYYWNLLTENCDGEEN